MREMHARATTATFLYGDHPAASSGQVPGSASLMTDIIGMKVSELRYKPYGKRL